MRAYRIAYDGQPYHGFQRQPDVATVEDAFIDALTALGVTDGEVPPGYAAAGRTDAGVSAKAQTVAFQAPEWLTPRAFNSELPETIQVWAYADVPEDFHATHHATEREYSYFLYASEKREDLARQALDRLAGDHDFHNLTPDDTGTERDLTTSLDREGPFFVIRFRAGGFPRQFVRRAVKLVADIAGGDRDLAVLDRVLSPEALSGPDGIAPAAPAPLVMTDVSYTDIEFMLDMEAVERTQRQFEEIHRQRAAEACVAATLSRVSEFDGN
jgi:tRNA pseudouridine38-40 synthase